MLLAMEISTASFWSMIGFDVLMLALLTVFFVALLQAIGDTRRHAHRADRQFCMLVNIVPSICHSGEDPPEDHHALYDIRQKLQCSEQEAAELLRAALLVFPGFRVIKTE